MTNQTDPAALVKRLRDRGVCSLAHNSCRNDFVCEEAADRIEELEVKLDDKEAECRHLRGQVNMVIPVLEEVQDFVKKLEPRADQGYALAPALYHACLLLNKLKEDRDE